MIDTNALRSKILDLAMRGKLTAQLQTDEKIDLRSHQASILLDDNPPYSIPNTWSWTTIGEVVDRDVGGGTPSKNVSEYWQGGTIPWASVKDFSSAVNGVLSDTIDHITPKGLEMSSSNLIDENAIVICMRMALGKIVKFSRPIAINQDLRALWLKPFVDDSFFIHFYSTLKIEGTGMTVEGIRKDALMKMAFPVPPLAEQRRIIARIDGLFSILDNIDALQARYVADAAALKSKLIDAGIRGLLTERLPEDGAAEEIYQQIQEEKMRLVGEGKIKKAKPLPEIKQEEVPFDVPKGWKWVRLIELGIFGGGKTPSMANKSYWDKGNISWITSKDMKQKYLCTSEMLITEEAASDLTLYPASTILLVVRSGILRRVLPVAILTGDSTVNQDIKAMTLYEPQMAEFVYYVLKGLEHIILTEYAKEGTTVNSIKFEEFTTIPVPLPPLAEQRRIVARLNELLPLCEN